MKTMHRWFAILLLTLTALAYAQEPDGKPAYAPVVGDILFQSLPHCPLVDAIEGATHSPYSHCGIVVKRNDKWYVLEAIGPVKETRLSRWIKQGRGKRYDAYRLRQDHRKHIPAFVTEARKFKGRPYDPHYRFDGKRIYCSELIYKAFRLAADERLGKTKRLKELNWKPFVPVIMSIEGKVPMRRKMITPRDLAEATQLELVHKGMKKPKK